MCSVCFLIFLLLLISLEHLVLVIEKMLSLLKPVIKLSRFNNCAVILRRLVSLYELKVSFDFADKFCVGIFVDLFDLTVLNSETIFVVSSHTFQQLQPLAIRHARWKDNQAYSKRILKRAVVQTSNSIKLADQFDAEFAVLLQSHASKLLIACIDCHNFETFLLLEFFQSIIVSIH